MVRFAADVGDIKTPPGRFCFKISQEAVKEPAFLPAAQQRHSVLTHFAAGPSLSPSLIIQAYLLKLL